MAQRKASGNLQEHLEDVTSLLAETIGNARMVKSFQLEDMEKSAQTTPLRPCSSNLLHLTCRACENRPHPRGTWRRGCGRGYRACLLSGDARHHANWGCDRLYHCLAIIGATSARSWHSECGHHQEAAAAGRRIFELIDTENKIKDDTNALLSTLPTLNYHFLMSAFPSEAQLLHNVTFTAEHGKTIALVGPSGAGKTSIINLVPRFVDATSGAIAINGQDIRGMTIDSLRAHIALVSQEAVIFDDTVAANIAFGKSDASRDDIIKATKDAAAHDFIMSLEKGYDTRLGALGSRLSGGQKQRLAIAVRS